MIEFKAIIEKFDKKGEKTGWTYIEISPLIASSLKPECKVSFRVKGKLDNVLIEGIALVPMGEGEFILAINKPLLKKINKSEGQWIEVQLEEHVDFKIDMPEDLFSCLKDEIDLFKKFNLMPRSHQYYYFNWLNTAKTESTRTKRIIMILHSLENNLDFGAMIRNARNNGNA